MDAGLLLVRLVIGGLFVAHGTRKLFGWFGGAGLDGTGAYFETLGYKRGRAMAALAGVAEAVGGLLLALGLGFPLAAAAIVGVMVNAVFAAHWDAGLWAQRGGYEYPLILAVVALGLSLTGPGAIALDAVLGIEPSPTVSLGLAALLGLVASFTVLTTGRAVHDVDGTEQEDTAPRPAS